MGLFWIKKVGLQPVVKTTYDVDNITLSTWNLKRWRVLLSQIAEW